MASKTIQSVKGTRDFYPDDMTFRKWLYGKVTEVSEKYGYQEFEGPSLEYLSLYADKTNEEILKEQVFALTDRDGKALVLRPEITPSFARMVAARAGGLPSIMRWFSWGRCWRYEQPQKGRGREFFQWEINILGPESPEADAEILAIGADFFKTLGLSPEEVSIRVSDRSYYAQICTEAGISEKKAMPLLRVIDRKEKLSADAFDQELKALALNAKQQKAISAYLNTTDYSAAPWLSKVMQALSWYGDLQDYISYDPTIARGFDYYTRTVFEAWDKTGNMKRALFGGGRFDNLTQTLGGPRIPGVGMAPGDMPIEVLLDALGRKPQLSPSTPTVLVTLFDSRCAEAALSAAASLRAAGIATECWPDSATKLDKQLKYADQKGIPFVLIIGPEEVESGLVMVKQLATRIQQTQTVKDTIDWISGASKNR